MFIRASLVAQLVKNPPAMQETPVPGLGRAPGEGIGYPLWYSGLENSMDYIVHGVTKSQTGLSNFHPCFPLLLPSSASSTAEAGKCSFPSFSLSLTDLHRVLKTKPRVFRVCRKGPGTVERQSDIASFHHQHPERWKREMASIPFYMWRNDMFTSPRPPTDLWWLKVQTPSTQLPRGCFNRLVKNNDRADHDFPFFWSIFINQFCSYLKQKGCFPFCNKKKNPIGNPGVPVDETHCLRDQIALVKSDYALESQGSYGEPTSIWACWLGF